MTNLLVDNIFLTVLVTIAAILADAIAYRLVFYTKILSKIARTARQAISDREKIFDIKSQLEKFQSIKKSSLVWGDDLAIVALSIDLAILATWVTESSQQMFPFFAKFNSANESRELIVWTLLISTHSILLCLTIFLKQFHLSMLEDLSARSIIAFPKRGWIKQNVYLLLGNLLGYSGLLIVFIVLTNSL